MSVLVSDGCRSKKYSWKYTLTPQMQGRWSRLHVIITVLSTSGIDQAAYTTDLISCIVIFFVLIRAMFNHHQSYSSHFLTMCSSPVYSSGQLSFGALKDLPTEVWSVQCKKQKEHPGASSRRSVRQQLAGASSPLIPQTLSSFKLTLVIIQEEGAAVEGQWARQMLQHLPVVQPEIPVSMTLHT